MVQRVLGLFLILFSTVLIPPVIISWLYHDDAMSVFLVAFSLIVGLGLLFWLPRHKYRRDLRRKDGFIIVVMFWVVLSLSGSLPFFLAENPNLSFTDAVFESVSELTTTGATVINGLDGLPKSLLFYRQELQWLGGMGLIVLGVAILPMLGIGGMQLYRAEIPGPMKTDKFTPRIAETAKTLWLIYIGLTITCATAYWFAGMSLFDAVAHSFSTIAIGGSSTHDDSFGYFNSPLIEAIAVFFIFLAGMNFSLHFFTLRNHAIKHYWKDEECRAYLFILVLVTLFSSIYLWIYQDFSDPYSALRNGLFYTISIGTTAGFSTGDGYGSLPGFFPVLLLMVAYIGACGGSTGGGMKVIRALLLYKQGTREIKRLIYQSATISIKMGDKSIPDQIIEGVSGFMAIYMVCFILLYLTLLATGLDMITAFSAVTSCLNNVGVGLGEATNNYENINIISKWTLCFAMLLGRLEIFPIIVLMTPIFWKQ
ncbi:TrkH family potassium uptake protein [Candidatus Nitrosacidococcus tergens]|uniref:Trk system potassium uptake protein n=1 Tax=Candidatus Nitrosacidococcus tergens TaxID=553981 RepID=A0A7G1Q788_9GAMM|nr:TrkH family potassium uptake protein [Candidatus Nitrosacidococcus tergens]CAB1274219.1 potassium transporter [Candidatus Nitrosacidococcus tergens]